MIDRFGNFVQVGWPAHHILWIRAAMSLEAHEMREAFHDIASLTGRSYACVWRLKRQIDEEDKRAARRLRLSQESCTWLAERTPAE